MHSPIPPSTQVDVMDGYTFDMEDTIRPKPCDVLSSIESNTRSQPCPLSMNEGEYTPLHDEWTTTVPLTLPMV